MLALNLPYILQIKSSKATNSYSKNRKRNKNSKNNSIRACLLSKTLPFMDYL
jgi:hypothetical protein